MSFQHYFTRTIGAQQSEGEDMSFNSQNQQIIPLNLPRESYLFYQISKQCHLIFMCFLSHSFCLPVNGPH